MFQCSGWKRIRQLPPPVIKILQLFRIPKGAPRPKNGVQEITHLLRGRVEVKLAAGTVVSATLEHGHPEPFFSAILPQLETEIELLRCVKIIVESANRAKGIRPAKEKTSC